MEYRAMQWAGLPHDAMSENPSSFENSSRICQLTKTGKNTDEAHHHHSPDNRTRIFFRAGGMWE